jgi:hypothetical protein
MKSIVHIYIFYSIIIKSYQCILLYIKKDFDILIFVKKKNETYIDGSQWFLSWLIYFFHEINSMIYKTNESILTL